MVLPVSDEQRERFEENLTFLRNFCPTLHKKLDSLPEERGFEVTSRGTLTLKKNGRYVESRYGPLPDHALTEDVEKRNAQSGRPVTYLGCGLGYHINRSHRIGSRSILVERDAVVFRAALYVIEPEILRELELFIDEDVSAVEKTLSHSAEAGVHIVEHGRSMQLHAAYYRQVKKVIENARGAFVASSLTELATMRLWLKNVLRNILTPDRPYFASSPLRNAFQGPVILVASGPFLEDVADDIRRWSRNIPLLALLPSVPFLHSCHISPDYVVTTDAGFWNRFRFVRGLQVPLISTFSIDPVLLRNWKGKRILFSHDLPVERLFIAVRGLSLSLPMQGTASLVMLSLARIMGFTEFYLAGYDFSFCGLKDHVRGAGFERFLGRSVTRTCTWESKMLRRLHADRLATVQDCLGGIVLSTHKLLLYRNWFEREIDLTDVRRLNRGVEILGMETASEDKVHAYGSGVRKSFMQQMKDLPEIAIHREKAVDGAQTILGRIEEAKNTQSKIQMHANLFGTETGTVDVELVVPDLQFVQRQISKLMERRT
jgi:hypothetical protein